MKAAATIDGEFHGSPDLHETLSTTPKHQSNDPYRNERRRVSTARRWNDIQRIFGWGGVLFHSWMPSKWFQDRTVSNSNWSLIVEELQSVRVEFHSTIQSRIPELAQVLLSTEIPG